MARKLTESEVAGYPLRIRRGITWSRVLQYSNKDGTPIDLTGMEVVVHLRDVFPTLTVLGSNDPPTTLGSEVVITDAANGKFRVKFTDEETLTGVLTTSSSEDRWWIELHDSGDVDLLLLDCATVEDI
jgi:hypothetical protein